MLKFRIDELEPGEEYAVMSWQGQWHLVKVDSISDTAQDLSVRWLAVGLPSFKAADDARVSHAHSAKIRAERERAGVCACGLPYDQH